MGPVKMARERSHRWKKEGQKGGGACVPKRGLKPKIAGGYRDGLAPGVGMTVTSIGLSFRRRRREGLTRRRRRAPPGDERKHRTAPDQAREKGDPCDLLDGCELQKKTRLSA